MKRLITASFAFALLNPLAVFAEEANTLKVKESVEINAKASDIWEKSSNFSDLGAWLPSVKKTELLEGENNKAGAVRLLTLQDGGTIKEKLKAYDAKKMSFTYEILEGVLPVSHYISTVSVKPIKDGKTIVVWEGTFKRKDTSAKPAQGQGDEDATKAMTSVYRSGLDNLKKISETK